MRSIHRAGEGRIGCVLWLAVLAAFLFICWRAVPVKLASAELYDFMEDQAGVSSRIPAESIQKRILKRAETPDDLIGVVMFLASPASAFITGQSIACCGGEVML